MRTYCFVIALCLAAGASAGEVYSWKDKDGRVHYSDTPPVEDIPSRVLNTPVPGSAPAGAPSGRPSPAAQEAEFRKRQAAAAESAEKTQQAKAQADERRMNCENSRSALTTLQSGQRLARVNAQGERQILDDEQRELEIAQARKAVESWCSEPAQVGGRK